MSTETILRTIRDGELRMATSTFTQLLSSDCPKTTTFEEKGEPKRNRTKVPLLTTIR